MHGTFKSARTLLHSAVVKLGQLSWTKTWLILQPGFSVSSCYTRFTSTAAILHRLLYPSRNCQNRKPSVHAARKLKESWLDVNNSGQVAHLFYSNFYSACLCRRPRTFVQVYNYLLLVDLIQQFRGKNLSKYCVHFAIDVSLLWPNGPPCHVQLMLHNLAESFWCCKNSMLDLTFFFEKGPS